MPCKDPTFVRTRVIHGYRYAVRVDKDTYSKIVAMAAKLNVPAAQIVKAAIVALWAAGRTGELAAQAATIVHHQVYRVSQIRFPKPRRKVRYKEGSE